MHIKNHIKNQSDRKHTTQLDRFWAVVAQGSMDAQNRLGIAASAGVGEFGPRGRWYLAILCDGRINETVSGVGDMPIVFLLICFVSGQS